MNTEEKRKALAKWILETDENVLSEVEAVYNIYTKKQETSNKVVGYTVNGEALTQEMYIKSLKKAEEGKFISSSTLKKKMLSW